MSTLASPTAQGEHAGRVREWGVRTGIPLFRGQGRFLWAGSHPNPWASGADWARAGSMASPARNGNPSSWARCKACVDGRCDLKRFAFILMHSVRLKHIGASVLTFLPTRVIFSVFWRCQEGLVLGVKVLPQHSGCIFRSVTSFVIKETFSGNVCCSAHPSVSSILSLPRKY